ncbi:MAG: 30S ribosomal protein S4 [Candidatus Aenigmatarchaeota archaeon]
MGHPRRLKKKYERPKNPFYNLEEEKSLLKEFGLKKKAELWRVQTELRKIRKRAMNLNARRNQEEEKKLLEKLNKIGLNVKTLDDVLKLTVKDLLSRRLQTVIFKKGLSRSIKHSRQLITHGHVLINNRRVIFPSFLVPSALEDKIVLNINKGTRSVPENKEAEMQNA